ncbi:MAG TPA: Lrp/AsnC family transcriptional regulator [Rubrobacter sp.]|nr:Lrp/AsnC family transcriptional regulator [Rubrobacter sp.]
MDIQDIQALRLLMREGRSTWSELARLLGLSAPAAADRVRRLEERGVIRGYSAVVDPEAVGLGVTAFVAVTLERPEHRAGFLGWVDGAPEVQECHHVAGEGDFLLKVRCAAVRDLEAIVSEEIKGLHGVTSTRTTVVLSTRKETPVLPLPPPPGG